MLESRSKGLLSENEHSEDYETDFVKSVTSTREVNAF